MRYYLDTEFNGGGGALISLALAGEDGSEGYWCLKEPVFDLDEWVGKNVIPIIDSGKSPIYIDRDELGPCIAEFMGSDTTHVVIADWPDDIKYFCEALITGPGEMIDIPGVVFHVQRVDAYPTLLPGAIQHNAMWDALALKYLIEGDGE